MVSVQIGFQAIDCLSTSQAESLQPLTGINLKVSALGRTLHSLHCHDKTRIGAIRSYSALRGLWWAALLLGVSAQQSTPFPASLYLPSLTGPIGLVLNGAQTAIYSGCSVASAGDINGDGIADLVIGADGSNSVAGKSFVIFGRIGLESSGSLALANLNGTNGFVVNGETNDISGSSVASAGDVNGDGIADLLISANGANMNAGKVYVIFGSLGLGSGGSFAPASLNGTNGFVLYGEQPNDACGFSVAGAGDVNNDGIADLAVGAFGANDNTGKGYVVFGKVGLGSNGTLFLANLNGINGFVLNGELAGDKSGRIAGAGDVNGDGIADLLIASNGANSNAGKSYVVFGKVGLGNSGSLALSSLNGANGFALKGEEADDQSGTSLASAGDVNGDGISDFVIGANGANLTAGKSYVIFGKVGLGSSGSIALSSLNGTNGFVMNGEQAGEQNGIFVASAGDVNWDGIADLLIGAEGSNSMPGKSYVIFGRVGLGSSGIFPLLSLNGTNGFVLNGEPKDQAGFAVARAGDINGDGIADFVIGALGANSDAGNSYVVFGRKLATPIVSSTANQSSAPTLIVSTQMALMTSQPTTTERTSFTFTSSATIRPTTQSSTNFSLFETSAEGHSPNTSPLMTSLSKTPVIVGVVIAVCAAASIFFTGIFVWYRKRKANQTAAAQMMLGKQSREYQSAQMDSAIQPNSAYQSLKIRPPTIEGQYDLAPTAPVGKEGVYIKPSVKKAVYTAPAAKPAYQSVYLIPPEGQDGSNPAAQIGKLSIYSSSPVQNCGYDAPSSHVKKDYDQPGTSLN